MNSQLALIKRIKLIAVTTLGAMTFSIGCAGHNRSRVIPKTEKVEATQAGELGVAPLNPAAQAQSLPERSVVSAIEFEPGRKGLSPEATVELNRAIREARQAGEVDEVNIVVWSDVEASAGQGPSIPKSQVELAKDRGKNIGRYMGRMAPTADVKIHNVAKEPSSFVQFLQSQNSTVQNKLATLGVATDDVTDDLKGRSSSALVLIKLK